MIRSVSGGVSICGGGERGTLFAVYRFLETLGCRWLAPEIDVVPRQPTLTVGRLEIDTRPAFEWRLFNGQGNPEFQKWGLKLGLNGFYTPQTAPTNGNSIYYPEACSGVHAYFKIIPNEPYFKEHPEWFPFLSGERRPSDLHGRQLCVTAEGLADEFAANVIRFFDDDPACQIVSISPNDGRGWCECDACLELDKRLCGGRTTKQGLISERPFLGDRVFWFANEVAARVAKKYPDKKLLVLAYINYAEPPDTVRPLPNVVPYLCHYAPADYSRPVNDPESESNRQFNDSLLRWLDVTPEILMYNYVSKSQWWRLPRPVLGSFSADVKYYHSLGVKRYYCQSTLRDWPLDGPLYYVIAKLLWDPSGDPQEIADEWTRAMFGPAAEDIGTFYRAVDAAAKKTGRSYAGNPRTQIPGLFDRQLLDQALAAVERAQEVPADEVVKQRVAEVAQTFHYGYRMVLALEDYQRYQTDFDVAAFDSAVAGARKALGYVKVRDAAKHVDSWIESNRMIREFGVPAQAFGEAETKGGRKCWNSDETGPGDNSHGWATFLVTTPDPSKPVVVEIDVWGMSPLTSVVVNTSPDVWTRVRPEKGLVKKEEWQTLSFTLPPEALDQGRKIQKLGFGGADSQIWIAEVRVREL